MTFDKVIDNRFGIKFGNNKLLFIKTGKGGNIYGYDNKYLKIANQLSENVGCSVVISANSEEMESLLSAELALVHSYVDFGEVYFVGISNGAILGAQQGYINPDIKRMLLINGPLTINWIKTKRGIESFDNGIVKMVYGTEDPSYSVYEILNYINNENFSCESYPGADHNFRGYEDEIIRLINDFLQ